MVLTVQMQSCLTTATQLKGSNIIKPVSIQVKYDLHSLKGNVTINKLIKLITKRVSVEEPNGSLFRDQKSPVRLPTNKGI